MSANSTEVHVTVAIITGERIFKKKFLTLGYLDAKYQEWCREKKLKHFHTKNFYLYMAEPFDIKE